MTTEEFLRTHICENCHTALMYDYKDKYLKCILCGFTKDKEIPPVKQIHKITGNNDNGSSGK